MQRAADGVFASYADDTPVYWVQEEPENMGAWPYLRLRLGKRLLEPLSAHGRLPRRLGQSRDRFGQQPPNGTRGIVDARV